MKLELRPIRGVESIFAFRKSRLLRNSLFNSCGWAATLIVNLAAIPAIIHYLGIAGYGVYALLTGIFGYFGLLDFGLSDGVVKYVAHYTQTKDTDSLRRSINAALVVQVTVGCCGVAFLCIFDKTIIHILRVPLPLVRPSSMALYVSAVGFLLKMLLNTYNSTLRGLQRFDVLTKLNVSFSTLVSITVVLALVLGGGLFASILTTTTITAVNLAVSLILTKRLLPSYYLSLSAKWRDVRTLFSFGAYVFISRIASTLNSYFLQVVIAMVSGPASVTFFAVPLKVTSAMEAGFNSFIGVIFPHISALTADGDTESMQRLYAKASRYVVALSTPIFLFVVIFSRQILSLWLGHTFALQSWAVLTLLCLASLLAVWTMVPANTIYGTGDTKIAAVFGSIVVALNLLFSVVLTLRYGIIGTATAVLLTAIQGPIFVWYVTRCVVKLPVQQYFKNVFAVHIMPAVSFCCAGVAFQWLTESNDVTKPLTALAAGAACCVWYYLRLLKRNVLSLSEIGAVSV